MTHGDFEVDEAAGDACRTIARLITREMQTERPDWDKLQTMSHDLVAKASGMPDASRARALCSALYGLLDGEARADLPLGVADLLALEGLPERVRLDFDVAIVTVLPVERDAVLVSLGHARDPAASRLVKRRRYWHAKLPRPGKQALSVVVTEVGKKRNVPCALAVSELLGEYSVDLVMLVGIAAGPETKVAIGDVVSSCRVLDYEGVRSELLAGTIVEKNRLEFVQCDEIQPDLNHLPVGACSRNLRQLRKSWGKLKFPAGQKLRDAPRIEGPATIAAGERLIADGTLPKMVDSVEETIRAGAMEDSGFSQACKHAEKEWVVFRGISDFGDRAKPQRDKWHPLAALSAASVAKAFLEAAYLTPEEQTRGEQDQPLA